MLRKWILSRLGSLLGVLFVATACGKSDIGEECDDAGKEDECVDGAICTNHEGEEAACRKLCEEQEDCAADESCNGVSNTNLKSCQPDNAD